MPLQQLHTCPPFYSFLFIKEELWGGQWSPALTSTCQVGGFKFWAFFIFNHVSDDDWIWSIFMDYTSQWLVLLLYYRCIIAHYEYPSLWVWGLSPIPVYSPTARPSVTQRASNWSCGLHRFVKTGEPQHLMVDKKIIKILFPMISPIKKWFEIARFLGHQRTPSKRGFFPAPAIGSAPGVQRMVGSSVGLCLFQSRGLKTDDLAETGAGRKHCFSRPWRPWRPFCLTRLTLILMFEVKAC